MLFYSSFFPALKDFSNNRSIVFISSGFSFDRKISVLFTWSNNSFAVLGLNDLSADKSFRPSTAKELFDQVNKTLILRSKLNPDEIKTIDLLLEKSFSAGKKDE